MKVLRLLSVPWATGCKREIGDVPLREALLKLLKSVKSGSIIILQYILGILGTSTYAA